MKPLLLTLVLLLAPVARATAEELPPPPPPPPGMNEPAPAELPLPEHGPPAPERPARPAPALPPAALPAPPLPPPQAPSVVAPAVVAESSEPEASEPPVPPRIARRRFDEAPLVLSAELGLGSLVGYGGVLAGYNVHDRFELDAGLGIAASGGPAAAINGHARPFLWYSRRRHELQAITVDVGFSFSRYETSNTGIRVNPEGIRYHVDLAHWFQYAFGWEMLTESGYSLRGAFGVALVTNESQVYCTNALGKTPCTQKLNGLPSLSFSVGHAF